MKRLLQIISIASSLNLFAACSARSAPTAYVADTDEIQNIITQSSSNKLLMVHIWATWCAPCVEEFPVLLDVAHTYRQNMKLLLISSDDPLKPKRVASFLQEQTSTHDSCIAANLNQEFIETLSPTWPGALPSTFFYRNGKLIAEHLGAMTTQQYQELIDSLLK